MLTPSAFRRSMQKAPHGSLPTFPSMLTSLPRRARPAAQMQDALPSVSEVSSARTSPAEDGKPIVVLENEIRVDLADDEDFHDRSLWIWKPGTTRVITPSVDGASGRNPSARQRKSARS